MKRPYNSSAGPSALKIAFSTREPYQKPSGGRCTKPTVKKAADNMPLETI
jgi:hypothetical protein